MLTSSEAAVALPLGVDLHARPAGVFVRTAMRFSSRIGVTYAGKTADAKSILAVLALGATGGATLQVRADGDDAVDALSALATCLIDQQ
jgi:phosphotransferase system HPr (HPr) family protein